MIRSHLGRLLGERRLKIADLARETGIHRNALTLLYRDEATRIDVVTIDKVCTFFGCKVGDLLEYVPERDSKAQ